MEVTWRQFSLALKNGSLIKSGNESSHAKAARQSHRVHRVIRKASQEENASVIELYSEFGIRRHIMEKSFDDQLISEVLAEKGLPGELAKSADDDSLDAGLQAEIDSAIEAAGEDIGVPTIVFTDKNGKRLGYFGPVLNELPSDLEESLAIWDGLEKLATVSSFYEIKRARPGGPNVFSAARC